MRENEVTVLRSTEERVAQTSRLSVKKDAHPLNLISVLFPSYFLTSCDKTRRENARFWGEG